MANKYNGDVKKDGTAVKMYDSKGNALQDGYSVNGTTYKADGSRIDVGTTVAGNDGNMYTYNGEGKASTVHTPTPVQSSSKSSGGSSSGAYVGGNGDYNTLAKGLADAQKQQQKANLQKALSNTLSAIATQEEATKTNTKNAKNNAQAQKMLNDRRSANMFANLGLTNSGTNAQSIINSYGALQNVLGGLDANNQSALNELARQRALAKGNYESDLANAYAGIDASALSNQLNYLAQMNQLKQQQEFEREMALQQIDANNIWDSSLGRYVPFSYYATAHNIGGSSGGSGGYGGYPVDYGVEEETPATTTKDENANGIAENDSSKLNSFIDWYANNALSNKLLFGDKKKEDNTKLTREEQILRAFGF